MQRFAFRFTREKTAQRFVLRNEKGAVLTLLICDLAAVTAKLLLLRFRAENRARPQCLLRVKS